MSDFDDFIIYSWEESCKEYKRTMNELSDSKFYEYFLTPWRVYYRYQAFEKAANEERFFFKLVQNIWDRNRKYGV